LIVIRILAALVLSLLVVTGCSQQNSGNASGDGGPPTTEVALEELNNALRVWMARSPTPPRSYEELVSSKYYGKPAPPAPPGKKYAIDRQQLKVVLVDQ
jgi:hypothetical protein